MLRAADPRRVLSSRAQSRTERLGTPRGGREGRRLSEWEASESNLSNQAPTTQITWRDQSPFARSFVPFRMTRELSVARYFAAPTEDLRFRSGGLGFLDVAGAIVKK